jgi:Na+/H+ antiporter NhaD/arsenite permease-like protein
MLRGLLVFAFTYVLVSAPRLRFVRLDRPAGAMVGAVLAVVSGAITPADATRAVDHTTLVLLFAVMGMGSFLSIDGFFERAGSGPRCRGCPTPRSAGSSWRWPRRSRET